MPLQVHPRIHLEQVREAAIKDTHDSLTQRLTTEDLREFFREVLCEDERHMLLLVNALKNGDKTQLASTIVTRYNTWVAACAEWAGTQAWENAANRLIDSGDLPCSASI